MKRSTPVFAQLGRCAAALSALGLAFALPVSVSLSSAHAQSLDAQQIVADEMRKDKLVNLIAETFPADFNEATRKIAANPDPEYAQSVGYELTVGLRKANANNIYSAPQATVKKVLGNELAMVRKIQRVSGSDTCKAYLTTGGAALLTDYDSYAEDLTNNGYELFSALIEGRGKEPAVSPPTDADWGELVGSWQSRGATPEQIQAIADPASNNDSGLYCTAFISFYEAVINSSSESGRRIQTSLVYGSASS